MVRWLLSVMIAAPLAAPAGAQLVIKRPESNFPAPPPIVLDQPEPEPGPQYPIYEGPEIRLSASCDVERLEAAGFGCSAERPCEFFLELASVASQGDWVILSGEIHTADAGYESVVLSSADGGKSWAESAERVLLGGVEAAQIADSQTAFVAGQQGDAASGEKPFLLVTDDAGESWDLRMISAGDADPRGTLVEFQADSPTHGFVILEALAALSDAFQVYETYNAGRSWAIRQISSDRPHMPGARLALRAPSWRVEPDNDAGQYVVSSRTASGWSEAARFDVAAGACPAP